MDDARSIHDAWNPRLRWNGCFFNGALKGRTAFGEINSLLKREDDFEMTMTQFGRLKNSAESNG